MKYVQLLLLISTLISLALSDTIPVLPVKDPNDMVLAFGSCSKAGEVEKWNKIFGKVAKENADVWAWLGDAVYFDETVKKSIKGKLYSIFKAPEPYDMSDSDYIKNKFNEAKSLQGYKDLVNSEAQIIGVWDDHDYACNDEGGSFKYKDRNKKLYLDFIGGKSRDVGRNRLGDGIFYSYYLGDEKLVKVILLDVRYNRKLFEILGESQWSWLEEQLADPTPQYILLGSGSAYLGLINVAVNMGTWPNCNVARLQKMIRDLKRGGIVFLSGDIHAGFIRKHKCDNIIGYPFYEFISSGMTHHGSLFNGEMCYEPKCLNEENYGVITFQRSKPDAIPDLKVEIKDSNGKVRMSQVIKRSELDFDPKNAGKC